MLEPTPDPEVILAQFNRLMQELLRGAMNRNCFRPWEVELLLDIETCDLRSANKKETLRRYQRAVQRHMEKGAPAPFKLSEFLEMQRLRRLASAAQAGQAAQAFEPSEGVAPRA